MRFRISRSAPPSWGRDAQGVYRRLLPRQVFSREERGKFFPFLMQAEFGENSKLSFPKGPCGCHIKGIPMICRTKTPPVIHRWDMQYPATTLDHRLEKQQINVGIKGDPNRNKKTSLDEFSVFVNSVPNHWNLCKIKYTSVVNQTPFFLIFVTIFTWHKRRPSVRDYTCRITERLLLYRQFV